MKTVINLFVSRLATLSYLLDRAESHLGVDGAFLSLRLIEDMLPLATQIAFTCNQPYNLVRWADGLEMDNLSPDLASPAAARDLIATTRTDLLRVDSDNPHFRSMRRLEFGGGRYVELTGDEYVQDFLVPNFYFHLVTAYDILRANGVPIGKADYMHHLLGRVQGG